jgi:uncharacterized hydrophobic protein (TIGR00341 family)
MPLRYMQIFVPEDSGIDLDHLLEGHEVLGTWQDEAAAHRVVHLLVSAEQSEPIMDRVEQTFSGVQGFRVVLLPVEAVLPRPEAPEDQAGGAGKPQKPEEEAAVDAGRVSREELYSDVAETLGVTRVFIAMTVLSSIVAAVGLIRDDVAVIIGAMVIAPLLGPNVAMSLATTLGDLKLLRQALWTNIAGVMLALVAAVLLGLIFTIDPHVPAIASRTRLGVSDLVLALAAGSAGTFAFTRGLAGAVIGVMVAVALMPPLVTFGMLLGSGQLAPALGAALLVGSNVVCINLAGVATFLAQGVRPRTWWEEQRAKKATRIAIVTWVVLLAVLGAIWFLTRVALSDAA